MFWAPTRGRCWNCHQDYPGHPQKHGLGPQCTVSRESKQQSDNYAHNYILKSLTNAAKRKYRSEEGTWQGDVTLSGRSGRLSWEVMFKQTWKTVRGHQTKGEKRRMFQTQMFLEWWGESNRNPGETILRMLNFPGLATCSAILSCDAGQVQWAAAPRQPCNHEVKTASSLYKMILHNCRLM